MSTLSDLHAAGTRVFWQCHECGAAGDVDLPALIAARGPDLDLTDRHPPCRSAACGYWVRFYAQTGQRTRPMTTPAGDRADGRRRTAWLLRPRKNPPAGAGGRVSIEAAGSSRRSC